jgi:hypothetical protein
MPHSWLLALAITISSGLVAGADEPPGLDAATRDALSQTLRGILVEAMPERIEEKDDWGATKEGFSGLTWRMDGLKLDVEKRKKQVNHGLWKMAIVEPIDVEQSLKFQIVSARPTGSGNGFTFRVHVGAPLHVTARLERWRQGVKLFNISTEGNAAVDMLLDGDLEYRFDTTEQGTSLVLTPRVTAVDLRLVDLDWQRIGTLQGDVAHELADAFTEPFAKQLDKQEPKAMEKIARAIAKRQDKLRVPIQNLFDPSRWSITDGLPSWAKP